MTLAGFRNPILGMIAELQDIQTFQELHWEGSFEDYLDLVREDPSICRNAYQRLYDLIASFGTTTYTEYKKRIVRYHFFDDPFGYANQTTASPLAFFASWGPSESTSFCVMTKARQKSLSPPLASRRTVTPFSDFSSGSKLAGAFTTTTSV